MRRVTGLAVAATLGFAAPVIAVDTPRLLAAASDPDNWITHGGTYLEQRYANLDQINPQTVGQLGLAWYHDLDTNRGQEATPLVIDGTLYTSTAWSKVVALDAATGRLKWSFDPQVPPARAQAGCCDVVNRGLAAYGGLLYIGTLDGRLIALDVQTGAVRWSKQTFDPSKPYTITGAPRVIKGKVLIGNGGAELGVRGYVTAYDAITGQKAWRFYTVPGNPADGPDGEASDAVLEGARSSWNGHYWEAGGGGTVWDAIVYDPEFDRVYIGVGNGSPWNHQLRSNGKGDNLFLASVVALNPDTGAYIWHYQGTPGESWDFTQTQPIILADLAIEGRPRKVLMQAPKNGYFYVIDRETGKLISAKGFVPQNWTTGMDMASGRPIETPDARFRSAGFMASPAAFGAHNWQPMAFSPGTGLVYLPAQELPFLYQSATGYKFRPGAWNNAVDMLVNAPPNDPAIIKAIRASLKGHLLAWDPVAQREVWRVQYDVPWNGGALATAGNLVFQGTAKGRFNAYDARSGAALWGFDAQTGVMAGPISYRIGDTQYVAVMAGYGGAFALAAGFAHEKVNTPPNGRLLVFKLGGTATLPPAEVIPLPPVVTTRDRFSPAEIAEGGAIYESHCGVCHGAGARSGGLVPDLRRAASLADKAVWKKIVHDGVLAENGMIAFNRWFSATELEAVRGYVAVQADALAKETAAGVGS